MRASNLLEFFNGLRAVCQTAEAHMRPELSELQRTFKRRMDWEALLMKERSIPAGARLVGLAISHRLNHQSGRCFVSYATLSDDAACCHRQAAMKAVKLLVERGWLTIISLGGGKTANEFSLQLPATAGQAPDGNVVHLNAPLDRNVVHPSAPLGGEVVHPSAPQVVHSGAPQDGEVVHFGASSGALGCTPTIITNNTPLYPPTHSDRAARHPRQARASGLAFEGLKKVFVELDTPQWKAWCKARGKKTFPKRQRESDGRIGWDFPSEWPPP